LLDETTLLTALSFIIKKIDNAVIWAGDSGYQTVGNEREPIKAAPMSSSACRFSRVPEGVRFGRSVKVPLTRAWD